MAYSKEVKQKVRRDFIRGMPLSKVADLHEIPYETTRSWKRKALADGDDWDNARAANRLSSSGVQTLTNEVIEEFVILFQTTIKELKDAENIKPLERAKALSGLSDAYQKTIKAIGDSNPKLSKLAVAMDVLKRFGDYLRVNHPELQESFLAVLDTFGQELARVYK